VSDALPEVAGTIRLRPMAKGDLDEVRRLEEAAYGSDAWTRRTLEDELVNGFSEYVVAEVLDSPGTQPNLAGFAGVWFMRDQVHLVTIAVDPERRRRGIAARLLLRCFELTAVAEMPSMVLEVRESNVGAQALYERFGFSRLGRLRKYYRDDGEDAIVMESGRIDGQEQRALLTELATRYGSA